MKSRSGASHKRPTGILSLARKGDSASRLTRPSARFEPYYSPGKKADGEEKAEWKVESRERWRRAILDVAASFFTVYAARRITKRDYFMRTRCKGAFFPPLFSPRTVNASFTCTKYSVRP